MRARLFLLLAAAGVAWALVLFSGHQSAHPFVGNLSAGALLACGLLIVVGALLLALALGPRRWLQRCVDLRDGLAAGEPLRGPPRANLTLCLLAGAAYVALVWRCFPLNHAITSDQREYLVLAKQIQQERGVPALIRRMFAGAYLEANRHPLFPAMLATLPSATDAPADFHLAKLLATATGTLALALLAIAAAPRFGRTTASLATLLLATNFAFVHDTVSIACEGLLVLWSGLLWLVTLEMGDHAILTSPHARRLSAGRWGACFGIIAALAYLTKATALLLIAAAALWLVGRLGRRHPRRLATAMSTALLAFLLLSSPLLVRNARVYGNPFHNSNGPFLFADHLDEALHLYDPSRPTAQHVSTPQAARRYFSSHTPSQVLRRLADGIVIESFIVLRTLGPAPLAEARALVGAAILLLALLGISVGRPPGGLTVIWLGTSLVFFGWYVPIASGDRFVLPLVVPVYVHAAEALCRLLGRRADATPVLLAAAAWGLLWGIASFLSGTLACRFMSP